ncbi:MAG: cation-translocating P-type ATPase [Acidobacteriota bacterium]
MALSEELCAHCLVPAGASAYHGTVAGCDHVFCCFGCFLAFRVHGEAGEEADATLFFLRLGVGAFLGMNVMILSLLLYSHDFSRDQDHIRRGIEILVGVLATPVMLVLGAPLIRDAWRAGRRGQITAETMIAVSSVAAYGYSVAALFGLLDHIYFDTATMLLLLFTVGRYLDATARARAARNLAPLLEAEIASVRTLTSDGEVTKRARDVAVGELVRVLAGERIPVDGEIVVGNSTVDQSLVTGEPEPIPKGPGDVVFAGTANGDGILLARTSASGAATHWAAIGRAVREALERRSRLQTLHDRIATYFLPLVVLVAAGAAVYWGRHGSVWTATSAALATLVVACPCALGPAAYLASFLGIGIAARRGIVIRSTRALQDLATSRWMVFDKTGCLTRGTPTLVAVAAEQAPEAAILGHAAGLALASDHPFSRALVEAARERGAVAVPATEVRTVRGQGLLGQRDGMAVALGSARFFSELGWRPPSQLGARAGVLESSANSLVFYGQEGRIEGLFAFADTLKPEAAEVLQSLRSRGLRTMVLSGDRTAAVRLAAESLAFERWRAEISPEEKLAVVRQLSASEGEVAMVGDGLNDAPVLAGAGVGIALGSGTELARTSADIVTADTSLLVLPWLVDLGRSVRRKTAISLLWAFGYNIGGVALAASGYLTPVLAAALMAASSILVIGNALGLEGHKEFGALPSGSGAKPGVAQTGLSMPTDGTAWQLGSASAATSPKSATVRSRLRDARPPEFRAR